jgi:hypothetical protein
MQCAWVMSLCRLSFLCSNLCSIELRMRQTEREKGEKGRRALGMRRCARVCISIESQRVIFAASQCRVAARLVRCRADNENDADLFLLQRHTSFADLLLHCDFVVYKFDSLLGTRKNVSDSLLARVQSDNSSTRVIRSSFESSSLLRTCCVIIQRRQMRATTTAAKQTAHRSI